MAASDYEDVTATRALQHDPKVIARNHRKLEKWGACNLLKVRARGTARTSVKGYITHLAAITGRTAEEIEVILGLREGDLALGADIYRLARLPRTDEFLPRGYTTLVDGLRLKSGLKTDSAGYRPGHGAYQITLTADMPAHLIATISGSERFEPGVHPSVAKLYPPGHPVRRGKST